MALIGKTNEEKIWNYLYSKLKNDYGVAGLIGNLKAESGLSSINLQNTGNKGLNVTDEQYTNAVNSGIYTNFVNDKFGYGLCQWTFWNRKQNLLNYARSKGVSIGDLEMQLDFLMQELQTSYKSVWNKLLTATSVRQASDVVLTEFEKPANQSESVKATRARYGQESYDKFANISKYYRVQCGCFSVKANALALEIKLKQAGFSTYIKTYDDLHKVQLGAFKNKANGEILLDAVKSKGFDAFLTYC